MPSRRGTRGSKASSASRAADVERAALGEEVHAASIEGRRAGPSGVKSASQAAPASHTGQTGSRSRRRWHPSDLGSEIDDLPERRDLGARDDVRPAGGGRHRGAQPQAFADVVDVRQVVRDAAGTEQHEAPLRDLAEQFEQAAIARAVDSRRPRDDQLDAEARRRCPVRARSPSSLVSWYTSPGLSGASSLAGGPRYARERRRCCNARRVAHDRPRRPR